MPTEQDYEQWKELRSRVGLPLTRLQAVQRCRVGVIGIVSLVAFAWGLILLVRAASTAVLA